MPGRLGIFREGPTTEWEAVGPYQAAYVPPRIRDAVRNPTQTVARMLMATTVRRARFFATIGTAPATRELRPPGRDDLHAFLRHAAAYGYALATPEENAAIGLTTPA